MVSGAGPYGMDVQVVEPRAEINYLPTSHIARNLRLGDATVLAPETDLPLDVAGSDTKSMSWVAPPCGRIGCVGFRTLAI